ncbi:Rha family transcriptional regulator [Pseudomonas sp. SWRI59]|uniref:Rha family transcriptional regulator n=1 Tax=unclassified Pseudomonas TaxID=196821 RepID=UPI001646A0BA|nr:MULTISPECIES: Rha family transcriptional regulator [unclassified Pseudomonas]MBC3504359.1 Rha family transcriptional regulator [Pseudomonas sp. SWRI59]MBC3509666.1 Rha family transcriptional regulator [Pseudomonas sp. SWRI68]
MSQVTHITGNTDAPLTMSSKEIAKLMSKRHCDVIRDVKKMMDDLVAEDDANLRHVEVLKDSRGYTSQIMLPRRETDILLTGYSVTLRAKVIDRWRELEAEVAKPATVNLSDASALRSLLLGYTR